MRRIVITSSSPENKWKNTIYITPILGNYGGWRYAIRSNESFAYDEPVWVSDGYGNNAKKILARPKVLGYNIFSHNNPDITLDDITGRLKSKNDINDNVEHGKDREDKKSLRAILKQIEGRRKNYATTQTIEQEAN